MTMGTLLQNKSAPGSLTVVGTGIKAGQITPDALSCIERAEKVLFIVTDVITPLWIQKINPTAEDLAVFYKRTDDRQIVYLKMVDRVLSCVRAGLSVCVVGYGHPGVFAFPLHESIRRARLEGFKASMLPGVSSEDCLFADLNIDPGARGCQSFEATDFLVHRRKFDPTSSLILWQIAIIGDLGYNPPWRESCARPGLDVLVEYLREYYDGSHTTIIYQASQYLFCDPVIRRVPLEQLPEAHVTPISTLYVPPNGQAAPCRTMLNRLGIPFPASRGRCG
jgi:tetrapyrrole (corrin/porphyrin) methylase-like protein